MVKNVLIALSLLFVIVLATGEVFSIEKSESPVDLFAKLGLRSIFQKIDLRGSMKNFIVNQISNALNGTLTIGDITGNLYEHLTLTEVRFVQDGQEIFYTPRLVLHYDMTKIWKQRVTIRQILIESPRVFLQQLSDGSWNVAHLIKEKSTAPLIPEPPAATGPRWYTAFLPRSFFLQEFRIRDGQLTATFRKPVHDQQRMLHNLHLLVSGEVLKDRQTLHIKEFRFASATPPFTLAQTEILLTVQAKTFSLPTFRIRTTQSHIEGNRIRADLAEQSAQGTLIASLNLSEISALIPGLSFQGELQNVLQVSGPLAALELKNTLQMDTGTLGLTGTLNLVESVPGYDLHLRMQQVNLHDILPQENMRSDLNMELVIQGKGVSPTNAQGLFRLTLLPSRLGEIALAQSQIKGTVQKGFLHLETLDLNAPFATLKGGGKIDLQGDTALRYTLRSDLSSLRSLLQNTTLAGHLQSQGEIAGSFQNLQARGKLQIDALRYNDLSLQKGTGTFTAQDLTDMLSAQIHTTLEGFAAGSTKIEQTQLQAQYVKATDQVTLELTVKQSPTRSVQLIGEMNLRGKTIQTTLSTLQARINGKEWRNVEPINVTIAGSRITVHSFRFGNANEFIQLAGTVDPRGQQDFQIQITNLHLQTVGALLGQPEKLAGLLNVSLTLRGDFQHPELTSQLSLTQSRFAKLSLASIAAELGYRQQQATLNLVLEPEQEAKFLVRGTLPVDLSFSNTKNRLLPQPLDLHLSVPRLRLTSFQSVMPNLQSLGGIFSMEGKISGTYWQPQLTGNMELSRGQWGTQWENVAFRLQFQGSNITVAGYIPSDTPAKTPHIIVGQFLVTADRFTATQRLRPAETVTREIRDLVFRTALQMTEATKKIEIRNLQFRTTNPEMVLQAMQAEAVITPTTMTLTLPVLRLQDSRLHGEGKLSRAEPSYSATLHLAPLALPEVGRIVGTPLEGAVVGNVQVQGQGKNLQVQGKYTLGGGSFQHTLQWQGETADPVYTFKSELRNLNLVTILSALPSSTLNLDLSVQGKGIPREQTARLEGNLLLHPSQVMDIQVNRSQFRFGVQGQALQLLPSSLDTSLFVLHTEGKVKLQDTVDLLFRLSPKDLRTLQRLIGAEALAWQGTLEGKMTGPLNNPRVEGRLQGKDLRYNDMTLETLALTYGAENLTSKPAAKVAGTFSRFQTKGVSLRQLELKAMAQGDRQSLVGRVELVASGGKAEQLQIPEIKGVVEYGEREIRLEFAVLLAQKAQLQAQGTIPNILRCQEGGEQKSATKTRSQEEILCAPVQLSVTSQNLDLQLLQQLSPLIQTARGKIELNLQAQGTVAQPDVTGKLQISNGALTIPQYGIRYRDVQANILFTSHEIRVDPVALAGGDGKAILTGVVNLEGFAPKDFQFQLNADQFTVMRDIARRAVLDTKLTLAGTPLFPRVNGTITLLEVRFPLPGFGGSLATVDEKNLTIQALTGEARPETQQAQEQQKKEPPDILKNLEARLRIQMAKNVWIHSPDASIELRGDIHVNKQPTTDFILEGTVETVRGFYKFQGRKFVLEKGEISFPGITEIDPNLNIVVTYKAAKYKVYITIGGTAKKPSLMLSSEPPLEQIDILSVLLFGRPSDQISQPQESSLASSAGQLLGIQSFVSGELQQTVEQLLGPSLSPDIIDINTGQGFSESSVSVGKYITEEVFVSFEQQFGTKQGSQVKVEYDISKNFKLESTVDEEGNSGVDLIWNFQY
jgi:autotransporter translocation and assembly factor TamB